MTEARWKKRERILAEHLKGSRIPSSGRAKRDIETPYPLCVEVKDRNVVGRWLVDAVEQAEMDAEEMEIPLAIIHQKGWQYPRDLVVMKFKYFKYLLERLNDKGE